VDDQERRVRIHRDRLEQPAIECAKSRKTVEQLGPVRRSRGRRARRTQTPDAAATASAPCVMWPAIHMRRRLCFASSASPRLRPPELPCGCALRRSMRRLCQADRRGDLSAPFFPATSCFHSHSFFRAAAPGAGWCPIRRRHLCDELVDGVRQNSRSKAQPAVTGLDVGKNLRTTRQFNLLPANHEFLLRSLSYYAA